MVTNVIKHLETAIDDLVTNFKNIRDKHGYYKLLPESKADLCKILSTVNEINTKLTNVDACVEKSQPKRVIDRKITNDTQRARGIWTRMRSKCYNEKHTQYYAFGARGIKVCERWDNFDNFYYDMKPFPENHSLNRWDWSKDFSKDNCFWSRSYVIKTVLYELRRTKPCHP